MERTTMAVFITAIMSALALMLGLIAGMGYAQTEGSKQLSWCVQAGGSYMTVSGNPVCIMPGQELPAE